MSLYKKVIVDIETTGLDSTQDEILQVSAIDQDANILINEYCKPKIIKQWEEAEKINGITAAMVADKNPFENYADILSFILCNTEEIIIYNADFEVSFFRKYGVKFNNNIYDLMIEFAEAYGQFNEYFGSYTWQTLDTCCLFYGYYLDKAHDSLEDCKATLYCYNKLNSNENRYDGTEYLGVTIKYFLDTIWKQINNKSVELYVYPAGVNNGKPYIHADINNYNDIKYQDLLNSKIHEIRYDSPRKYSIGCDRSLQADYDLLLSQFNILQEKNIKLKKENIELIQKKYELYQLYDNEKDKNSKLEKRLTKMKEKLGLVLKKEMEISMFNSYGYYTADYCKSTGKPIFKNSMEYKPFSNKLLSKTRCKYIKMPIKENEEIYAFYKVKNGYCALYFRDLNEDG